MKPALILLNFDFSCFCKVKKIKLNFKTFLGGGAVSLASPFLPFVSFTVAVLDLRTKIVHQNKITDCEVNSQLYRSGSLNLTFS